MSRRFARWLIGAGLVLLVGCNTPQPVQATPSPTVTQTVAAAERTAIAQQATRDAQGRTAPMMATLTARAADTLHTTTARPPTRTIAPTLTHTLSPTPTSESPFGVIGATPTSGGAPAPTATFTPAPGQQILSFTASATTLNPGESFTLAWQVASGEPYLCSVMATGQLGTCALVPLTGSQQVTTRPEDRNFVQWMLFLDGPTGEVAESATVNVALTCPDTWFFSPPPDNQCPRAATRSGGAVQRFQNGMMIWVAGLDAIFVLYSDSVFSPKWEYLTDPWADGMAEEDPGIEPPAGFYEPVRGFGMVWRSPSSGYVVRDRLGWATEPERGFETAYQCDSAPKYNTCYLLGPDGVLELEPERSAWHPYTGP